MDWLRRYAEAVSSAFYGMVNKAQRKLGKRRFKLLIYAVVLINLLLIVDMIPEPRYITEADRIEESSIAASTSVIISDSASLPDDSGDDGSQQEVLSSRDDPAAVQNESSVPESDTEHENALKPLKAQVEEALSEFPGEWSAYCKNLNTGDWFTINEHPVYPASMIKLFALAACYQKIEDGEIDENEYYPTIYNMAAISNNQAFNQMVWTIGKTYITEWCHSHGLPNTAQYHGLQPSTNYEGLETSDKRNVTCVSDVGHILESIYRGECVSKYASEKMLDILMHQKWTSKIPFGLPNGTKFANKTGDTYDVTHDAAIVYSDGADYVLVLMCEQENTSHQLKYCFIQTSKLVYKFFNPGADY